MTTFCIVFYESYLSTLPPFQPLDLPFLLEIQELWSGIERSKYCTAAKMAHGNQPARNIQALAGINI